jgi:small GTP-binding protein
MANDKECSYKIVLLGGPSVGKSALTMRMITDNFVKDYEPTIEDTYTKDINLESTKCTLKIVDTAGMSDLKVMIDNWISEGDGFLLVFSIIDANSFPIVEEKRSRILKVKEKKDIPMLLVGTKLDMENKREVPTEKASSLAKEWGIEYVETSSLNSIRDKEVFYKMAKLIRESKNKVSSAQPSLSPQSTCCCTVI